MNRILKSQQISQITLAVSVTNQATAFRKGFKMEAERELSKKMLLRNKNDFVK